jgi:hypothetical protein
MAVDVWHRVFGSSHVAVEPAALLSAGSRHIGAQVTGRFKGDDLGWFEAELGLGGARLELQRFLTDADDLRDELNSWAAWLETVEDNADSVPLMRQMIATTQLFTLRRVDQADDSYEDLLQELCVGLCQFLAGQTAGVYQVDGKGFFDAEGLLLVKESEPEA